MTRARDLADSADKDIAGTLTLDAVNASGVITANAGVVVDNITIDGTEIDLSSGDLTLDVAGDIILDADGGDVSFRDAGVGFLNITNSSTDAVIQSLQNDKDLIFKGVDNSNSITALTLDMSAAGQANFNAHIKLADDKQVFWGDGTVSIQGDAANEELSIGVNNVSALAFTSSSITVGTGSDLITNSASGTTNIRFGSAAGDSIVASNAGLNNICIGTNAGTALDSGDSNIAIGDNALLKEDDHANNIAIGSHALEELDAGGDAYTVGVGYYAGSNATTALYETFVGGLAGSQGQVTGTGNTATGFRSGEDLAGGYYNTFAGMDSGANTTSGYENIALGYRALFTNTHGRHVVAIGAQTLDAANPSSASSTYNVAVGYAAGLAMLTGAQNTVVGGLVARNLTTANDCAMFGTFAGYHATTATQSTFLGSHAGYGVDATKLTGTNNTAVGYAAGYKLQGAATGNQLFGNFAGDLITTGTYNLCLGYDTGSNVANLTTGNKNILIGYKTSGPTTGDNAIGIGDQITVSSNDFSFGKASNIVTNDFDADAAFSRSSDERLKKNITNQTLGLDFINDLRTVKYNWKSSDELDANDAQLAHLRRQDDDGNIINDMNTDVLLHNFIAQEVKASLDKAGVSEFGGWKEDQFGVQQVSREMFVIPLVKAVQELSTKLDAALARIATLEG